MTYETQDRSVHDARPVEAYRFVGPFGEFRYNDGDDDVTLNFEVYTSMPVSRSAIEVAVGGIVDQSVDVEVPFDSEVAIDHGYLTTPDYLDVTIYRWHRGSDPVTDVKTIWKGRAQQFSINGLSLRMRTSNALSNDLNEPLLSVYYQTTCNHVLYDDRCKANPALHTTSSTVTIVGPAAITVTNDGVADGDLVAGECVNNRTGERRLIRDNLANVLTLAYGFTDIVVGDTVDMIKGCFHNITDCEAKFENDINYGGFRFIPRVNPIDEEIFA